MERIAYYGYAALLGALGAFSVVVVSVHAINPVVAYACAAAFLFVLFDALRTEFSIPNNKRAVGYVLILFVSAGISTIASMIWLG